MCTDLDDNVVPSNKTNIFVAAFTTAWARLRLYEALDVLQQQVLYRLCHLPLETRTTLHPYR